MGGFGIGEAANLAAAGAGMAIEATSNRRGYKWGSKMAWDDQGRAKDMARFNYDQQMRMWQKTGPQGQMEQLKAAGLNPGLIYGMGGAGGQTAGAAEGQSGKATMSRDNIGMNIANMGQQAIAQIQLLQAQKENIEADTKNKLGDAANKPLVGKNLEADTANKVVDTIIKDYTGREAKDQYERVKVPNRGIEAKTWEDELSARQGIAGTIYEMWQEGKLKEMSNQQLEELQLKNAKTSEETRNIKKAWDLLDEQIKGQKISNMMADLESKMFKETGLTRNSADWLKIINKLFDTLLGR